MPAASHPRRPIATLLSAAVALGFALPVLAGIGLTALRLVTTSDVDVRCCSYVHRDAEALFLGEPLYQDPADGYTGTLYTPLVPLLVSLLYRITPWVGWPVVTSITASLVLLLLVARVAYRAGMTTRAERLAALVEAVGVGALGWWLVSGIGQNMLFASRTDQAAWAFALAGAVAMPRAIRGGRRWPVLAVLCLSAGFWAKQTTIAVDVAVVLWLALSADAAVLSKRAAAALVAALILVNGVVLGLLNLLTHGWEWFFNFELPQRHYSNGGYLFLDELVRSAGLAAALAAALGALALISTRRDAAERPTATARTGSRLRRAFAGSSPDRSLACLLVVVVGVGAAAATYFERKQGSEDNQYVGVVWALALLCALGYRRARRDPRTATLATGLLGVLFVVALLTTYPIRADRGLERLGTRIEPLPPLVPAVRWRPLRHDLVAYSRAHRVYLPNRELGAPRRETLYPSFSNLIDLLAAGEQPTSLVRAILARRFDALAPIPDPPFAAGYTWAFGKWEENYIWKLNRVILAEYRRAAGLPAGLLARRAGPNRGTRLGRCFGPFSIGRASLRIHRGGGFWCRAGADALLLLATPAPRSELVTEDRVDAVDGVVGLRLGAAGSAQIVAGSERADSWSVRVRRASARAGDLLVVVRGGGRPRALLTLRVAASAAPIGLRGKLSDGVELSVAGRRVRLPAADGARLSFSATRASRARFALGTLRIY